MWIQNDLKWVTHVCKLTSDMNYVIAVIRRLRSHLSLKELKTITDGMFMSQMRYALSVFDAEFLRIKDSDPTSTLLQQLQRMQNDLLRAMTGKRRSDREKISVQEILSSILLSFQVFSPHHMSRVSRPLSSETDN